MFPARYGVPGPAFRHSVCFGSLLVLFYHLFSLCFYISSMVFHRSFLSRRCDLRLSLGHASLNNTPRLRDAECTSPFFPHDTAYAASLFPHDAAYFGEG